MADDPPEILLDAYDLLLQRRSVDIIRPLGPALDKDEGAWQFGFEVRTPGNNAEGLPPQVQLRAVIDDHFPLSTVRFYPEGSALFGFPHQDAETGKLCLPDERDAPLDERRLYTLVEWARGWVEDAANGNLAPVGDPYELPDFSRKLLKQPLPTKMSCFFVEDKDSFDVWRSRVGQVGEVDFVIARKTGVYAVRFRGRDGTIFEPQFGTSVKQSKDTFSGQWAILPDIRAYRHRPAHTYKELSDLCTAAGIDLFQEMRRAWNNASATAPAAVLLIGFPIPATFGGEAVELHWQPLIFTAAKAGTISIKGFRPITGGSAEHWKHIVRTEFNARNQLPWGEASNISAQRLYARAALSGALTQKNVTLVGCGALGSVVAELLARGGVGVHPRHLNLVDPQGFDLENACRHTLDGTDLLYKKAAGLALRLSSACPLSQIDWFSSSVPGATQRIFENSDLVVDCTANTAAFISLDGEARRTGARLITMFLSFRADYLTLAASGDDRSSGMVLEELYSQIRNGKLEVKPEEYFAVPSKTELVLPGVGCWHPTFPATAGAIWLLASAAVDLISQMISPSTKSFGALLKRDQVEVMRPAGLRTLWQHQGT